MCYIHGSDAVSERGIPCFMFHTLLTFKTGFCLILQYSYSYFYSINWNLDIEAYGHLDIGICPYFDAGIT